MESQKKQKVQLGEDGLPNDDVRHYAASPSHLSSYDQAADSLYKFKVPALLDTRNPHSYLIVGLMDGTGNDVHQDALHATNVSRFETQVQQLRRTGVNIDVEYIAGAGTQASLRSQIYDGARGSTSLDRAEIMYDRLVRNANRIYNSDPRAEVSLHIEGFSRGASQVPLLARMIHDRGIPNYSKPEYVRDDVGNVTKTYPHFHKAPGQTAMSVGLYDPVPTGTMEMLDRRLPPSVVSGFQINAADEKRGTFPVDRIIPKGMSEDGRFLSVTVAGAHSDVGGSYLRNGLGTRSQNLMTDYHNSLFSDPLLNRLPETYDPRLNVIHRSEEGGVFKYLQYISSAERDTPSGEVTTLARDYSHLAPPGQVVHAPLQAPEALGEDVAGVSARARPVVRSIPTQMTAASAEEQMAQVLARGSNVEVTAYREPMHLTPGNKMALGLGASGAAASLVDAWGSAERASTLLSQDNPLAAQSALTHYAARGTGGWVGGAVTGLAVGWETGPGVIGFVAVGALAGSHVGENAAKWWDNKQIYEQKDKQGVEWEYNGRQWLRQEQADLSDNGIRAPTKQSFSALPDKERELNYLASNAATKLALGNVEPPRDPYNLPANETDAKSLGDANWKRDGETGNWQRETIVARMDRGHPLTRTDTASPERAAELDRDAEQVIKANIASGPAPIAARYELAYKAYGWQSFGETPAAVTSALDNAEQLTASNKEVYRRGQDGQWRTEGGELAQGNTVRELNGTRAQLQPALAQHAEQLAAAPAWTPPTRADLDRINLHTAYAAVGVAPSQDRFDAAVEAVQRTREVQGIDANVTSLYVERNEKGGYDTHSPIVHLARDAQGVHVAAVTSSQEIELALIDQRGVKPPVPNTPELRIAALSPQQRDAQDQMIREANRQGASNDQVQQVAVAAATAPTRADTAPPVREAEAVRVVAEPEPVAALKVAEPQTPAPPQAVAVTEVAPPEAKLPEPKGDPKSPSIEAEKPDVLATKSPAPDQSAPRAATPPSAPAEAPAASAPQFVPPLAVEDAPAVREAPPAAHRVEVEAAPAVATEPAVAAQPTPKQDDGILRPGDRGQEVELLQYRLQRVGYRGPDDAPAPERGHYDAATEHAVRHLQRDHGLAETGRVAPDTLQALAVAQQAKIEARKAAAPQPEIAEIAQTQSQPERIAQAPGEVAPQTLGNRESQPASPGTAAADVQPGPPPASTARDVREANALRGEPKAQVSEMLAEVGARDAAQPGNPADPRTTAGHPIGEPARDRRETDREIARMSPADQAMFAKIRGATPADVSDEVVAKAMLEAKRNGIPDVERVGQVGVVDGKLWVGSVTPGFQAAVSANGPAPNIQETLKETQLVNQQRDQQLAMEAAQRQQDEQRAKPIMH
ncbi:peptidoglycan hydrolase-like protein with peptidoglycan-binding domain [Lysobacter enzymogenes]|uniref:phospholipase effector Tle1 domain-containing protein n=1 Tax=Lysobacter enzymogenes TaxID=69 RepID=UPI003393F1FB